MAQAHSFATGAARHSAPPVLPIRCENEIRLVLISDIWYCTWTRNTALVVTSVGELRVSKTLDALEARLERYGFFRAHRSYVVNL